MQSWWNDLKRIGKLLVGILAIVFTVFIINQFLGLYQALRQVHPYVAIGGVVMLAGLLLWALVKLGQLLRHNQPTLTLAEDADEDAYMAYLDAIISQLDQNPYIVDPCNETEQEGKEAYISESFAQLNDITLPIIKENANAIFLTTAISQNGSLDSFIVLFTLIRLVWQLASIYQTRPSLGSLLKLYSQVGSVVFMARTIEDADLIEDQLEPLIAGVLGESIASAIPGMVPIANLIVSSIMEGAVNAFLTLRVGFITQAYLSSNQDLNRQKVRRSASTEALKYLGTIIKDNSKSIIKKAASAAKNASTSTAKRWFSLPQK